MNVQELVQELETVSEVNFTLPDGRSVPTHYHVTEVGEIRKTFVDCGNVLRDESKIVIQLWEANDYDHRMTPEKFKGIIQSTFQRIGFGNHQVEVEYQGERSIERFSLNANGQGFQLESLHTDCLAKGTCGIPEKKKVSLADLQKQTGCDPNSGCC
ncbi:MAG: hypothetical protein HRT74_09265 [Flavobacteriales bacterium]|nr:hypothetical protein [Flavobacteriales bacterium]